ncbi:alpha-lactalbumin-like [Sinocyclocheilus anshuiensis]|uniref:alpha-lactalbumin-like n=1 Tax=Sinocyclocheilus anshuiensis TaxID=1608454 RepID=UPI0007B7DD8C|nr:PREDICTED: alpha-lactalbumin-like [Sinocyclocheilus anshuiensis]
MLAVVVVLFLAVGVSDGVILSKCELKQQLERGLTLQIPNSADVLAQIVCHVQLTSGFNTSAVKTIAETQEPRRGPGPRRGRSPGGKSEGGSSSNESDGDNDEVWTLYGLFQLSDHVVCNSAQSRALNLCRLSCDKLIDDNTSDDIACVQALINAVTSPIPDPKTARHIHEMISLIHQPECMTMKATSYFANCQAP